MNILIKNIILLNSFLLSINCFSQPTSWEITRFIIKLPINIKSQELIFNKNIFCSAFSDLKTYGGRVDVDSCFIEVRIEEMMEFAINDTLINKKITLKITIDSNSYYFVIHNLPNKDFQTYLYLGEIKPKINYYEYFIVKSCCQKEILKTKNRKIEIYDLRKYRKGKNLCNKK
ncbi:MAG: hypothetical protein M3Q58_09680 [Bacteroidota bacterium]|nr:hypothetical protein [Bacteroidota bacterium]